MTKSVAIVTGASQGIGRSTAIRLARDFEALVLVARNRGKLEATAGEIEKLGKKVLIVETDLAEISAPGMIVEETLARFGRIDALLNIAGAVPQIDLFEMTDEQWDAGFALKLYGARRLTIAAWPALKEARGRLSSSRVTPRNSPRRPMRPWERSTPRSWRSPRPFPIVGSRTGCRLTAYCPAR